MAGDADALRAINEDWANAMSANDPDPMHPGAGDA